MRPVRIVATNCVCYKSLELDVSELTHLVIIGENGVGKSLLLDIIRVAVVGIGRVRLGDMIGPWGDQVSIDVQLEHRGWHYRSVKTCRRQPSGRLASTAELLKWDGSTWATCATSPESEFGLTTTTAAATTFLDYFGKNGLGAFGAGKASDRREILYELRNADRYAPFAKSARAAAAAAAAEVGTHRREQSGASERAARYRAQVTDGARIREQCTTYEAQLAGLDTEIAELAAAAGAAATARESATQATADLQTRQREHSAAADTEGNLRTGVAELEAALGQADKIRAAKTRRDELATAWRAASTRRQAAAAERHAAAEAVTAARGREQDARTALTNGQKQNEQAERAEGLQSSIEADTAELEQLTRLRDAVDALATAAAAVREGDQAVAHLADVTCGGEGEYAACPLIVKAVEARDAAAGPRDKLDEIRAAAEAACTGDLSDETGPAVKRQIQDVGARLARSEGQLRSLRDAKKIDLSVLESDVTAAVAAVEAAVEAEAAKRAVVEGIDAELAEIRSNGDGLKPLAERITVVQRAETELAGVRARHEAIVEQLGQLSAAVDEAKDRVSKWSGAATAAAEADRRLAAARERQRGVRAALDSARGRIPAATDADVTTAEAEAEAARQAAAAKALEQALYTTLATFHREAPDLVIENDQATIAATANAWLSKTSDLSLELATLAPTKKGSQRPTIAVNIDGPDGRVPRSVCSGGQKFRIDVALALGIGSTLGPGSNWLCIDEGFGSLKGKAISSVTAALEDLLADEVSSVWAVSHVQQVVDVFPAQLVVRRGAEGSTVEIVQ